VKQDGTIALKDVEMRLELAVLPEVSRQSQSEDALNFEQLNFDEKSIIVLEPNGLLNLDVLVKINNGGSNIWSKTESMEFPPMTSILCAPVCVRAIGVKPYRV
jgi:hypothetical protein